MPLNVYIATITGNTEIRKQVQKTLMILDGLRVPFNAIDITLRGNEQHRTFMRENAINERCSGVPLPPQFFDGEKYLGNYIDFEEAVEDNTLPQFLRLVPDNKAGSSVKKENGKEGEKADNDNQEDEEDDYEGEEGESESETQEETDEAESEGGDEDFDDEEEDDHSSEMIKPQGDVKKDADEDQDIKEFKTGNEDKTKKLKNIGDADAEDLADEEELESKWDGRKADAIGAQSLESSRSLDGEEDEVDVEDEDFEDEESEQYR